MGKMKKAVPVGTAFCCFGGAGAGSVLAAKQMMEEFFPTGRRRRGIGRLLVRFGNCLLHEQCLRAHRIGNGRLFAVRSVRLQDASLNGVMLHGV